VGVDTLLLKLKLEISIDSFLLLTEQQRGNQEKNDYVQQQSLLVNQSEVLFECLTETVVVSVCYPKKKKTKDFLSTHTHISHNKAYTTAPVTVPRRQLGYPNRC
jgi:hypothetical protein